MSATREEKVIQYERLSKKLMEFLEHYPCDTTGRMATLNSFLRLHFPHMWFVGFYTVSKPGESLQIGPYQGAVLACGTIAFGKGVCGTAAASGVTQVVPDVTKIENYIACDEETKSEIVVPVYGYNYHNEPDVAAPAATASSSGTPVSKLIAVLDIDSEQLAAFDDTDAQYLEKLCAQLFAPAPTA